MVVIEVCVGSSCHLKGSYGVVEAFDRLIAQHQLENQVELRGVFCLEHCTQGVTVRIGDQLYPIRTPEQAVDLFRQVILAELRGERDGDHHHQPGQL